MSFSVLRRSVFTAPSALRAFSTSSSRSIAKITIVGNLADTPELQATSSGREVVRYAVASNSGPRDNRKTSWFRVSSFVEGPQRDFLLSLPKGAMLYVEGDASNNSFTDGSGQQRTAFSVIQRNIEVLKRPYNQEQNQDQSQ